jgi:predicted membrane protein (TIGR00267 family)
MEVNETLEGAAFGVTDGIIAVLGTLIGAAAATDSSGLTIIAGVLVGVSNSFANSIGVYISQSTERGVQLAKAAKGEKIQVHTVRENIISAVSAFLSAIIVSLLMVIPFLFLDIFNSMIACFVIGIVLLFVLGAYTAKISQQNMIVHGFTYAFLGMVGAILGFLVGEGLKGVVSF